MELEQHHLSLAQRQRRKRIAHRRAARDVLERLFAVPIAGELVRQLVLGLASTSTQLVERRVTRDREQPGPGGSAAMIQTRARAVEALERKRGHILGRRAVAEQRDGICVHVGPALPEERSEGPASRRGGRRDTGDGRGACSSEEGTRPAHHPNYVRVADPSHISRPRGHRAQRFNDYSAGPLGCAVPYVGLFIERHRPRMAGAGPRREKQEEA